METEPPERSSRHAVNPLALQWGARIAPLTTRTTLAARTVLRAEARSGRAREAVEVWQRQQQRSSFAVRQQLCCSRFAFRDQVTTHSLANGGMPALRPVASVAEHKWMRFEARRRER